MGIFKIGREFSLAILAFATCQGMLAVNSPNGRISVDKEAGGVRISYCHYPVMLFKCGDVKKIVDNGRSVISYGMKTGKRSRCSNECINATIFLNDGGIADLRVYNDGVAWRCTDMSVVDVSMAEHEWLQQWSQPYEEFYLPDRVKKSGDRWAFPALFEYDDNVFVLLTESGLDKGSAGASMYSRESTGVFDIISDDDGSNAWVTAIIGGLSDVVESTLVTDNSEACRIDDTSWILPGVSSWVYWAYNHGSRDYDIVKRYVDMSIKLGLPYVLIDAEWDEMDGNHNILDILDYANANDVKPLLWYNSSVGWIDGAPGPKFRLNDSKKREEEFAWCEANGVKGVKIDFFSGDNKKNMEYMIELLDCAARHHLLVNFHGATLPRGWQRTYPNLMSMEAVYGAEWYNNVPTFTDKAARHNATLPFTRNIVGSMDYTPCAFSDSQHPHITTNAHELALSVIFESGIQHIADSPESIFAQPKEVQYFFSNLPAAWDDTYFLGGYPGDYAILAREKNGIIFIAGINGDDSERRVDIDIHRLGLDRKNCSGMMYCDGENSAWDIKHISELPEKLLLKPRGGFVITIDR